LLTVPSGDGPFDVAAAETIDVPAAVTTIVSVRMFFLITPPLSLQRF
jgi:hypothetical protein